MKYYIYHYCEKYLKVKISAQHINNFYTIYYFTIRDIVKDEQHKREVAIERERMANYEASKGAARMVLLSKVLHNKRKLSLAQVKNLNHFKPLLDKDINEIYREYEQEWDKEHPEKEEPKKPKVETFGDKLDKYVVEHMNDNLMTFDEFERVIIGWNRGRKSIEQCYEEYKQKYFKQPGTTVTYKFNDPGLIGYKGKDKIKTLTPLFPNKHVNENKIKSSFDLKNNIKHYQLHKCSARNTWIIDFMFCDKLAYLVAINANTKYLYVELVNKQVSEEEFTKGDLKSAVSYLNALQQMMNKGMNVKHLTGDGEKAFIA